MQPRVPGDPTRRRGHRRLAGRSGRRVPWITSRGGPTRPGAADRRTVRGGANDRYIRWSATCLIWSHEVLADSRTAVDGGGVNHPWGLHCTGALSARVWSCPIQATDCDRWGRDTWVPSQATPRLFRCSRQRWSSNGPPTEIEDRGGRGGGGPARAGGVVSASASLRTNRGRAWSSGRWSGLISVIAAWPKAGLDTSTFRAVTAASRVMPAGSGTSASGISRKSRTSTSKCTTNAAEAVSAVARARRPRSVVATRTHVGSAGDPACGLRLKPIDMSRCRCNSTNPPSCRTRVDRLRPPLLLHACTLRVFSAVVAVCRGRSPERTAEPGFISGSAGARPTTKAATAPSVPSRKLEGARHVPSAVPSTSLGCPRTGAPAARPVRWEQRRRPAPTPHR